MGMTLDKTVGGEAFSGAKGPVTSRRIGRAERQTGQNVFRREGKGLSLGSSGKKPTGVQLGG